MRSPLSRIAVSAGVALAGVALLASVAGPAAAHKKCDGHRSHKFSFGVMGDTQWTTNDPASQNPNTVPVSIIKQVNQQFIDKGVKFVIEVGDLTDDGQNVSEDTRAAAAQQLYNAGIGFFPFRGNHETYGTGNSYAIPELQKDYPQTRGLANTFGARDFSSPTNVSSDLNGMSYSFDYGRGRNSARFVMLDNWVTPSKDTSAAGYDYGYSFGDQQSWISSRLDKDNRGTTQAFVFAHQPLIAENHQDSPFVGYTNANPAMQNAFIASLQNNDVKYYISGHDHICQRSVIASPDGVSSVEEIISASNSSKFYTPKALDNANWFGQKSRETSIDQDAYRVGYYIYTVDGPRVTVDYYADDHGSWQSDANYPYGTLDLVNFPLNVTPTFHFVKRASWGYSLNGKEFIVGGGAGNGSSTGNTSYSVVKDSHDGTSMQILAGSYDNLAKDVSPLTSAAGSPGRTLAQAVDTGWTDSRCRDDVDSDILTLWGMTPMGATQTDTYALSMSVHKCHGHSCWGGCSTLLAKDANGRWVKAVDLNAGGTKKYMPGAYKSTYGLGTYGYDPKTGSVWAVVNHEGTFAISDHVGR